MQRNPMCDADESIGLRMTGRWPITPAVVRRTQVRAAFDNFSRDLDRVARIAAVLRASASRILRDATRLGDVGRVLGHVPIDRPFPHVADHVGQAVSVWRKDARLGRCPHIRPSSGSPRETPPARYWRGVDRSAGTRRPTRRPLRRDRREPHVPIRLLWAASCLPTARRPRRPPTSHGQPDGARARRVRCPVRGVSPMSTLHPVPPVRDVPRIDAPGRLDEHQ